MYPNDTEGIRFTEERQNIQPSKCELFLVLLQDVL